MNRTIVAAAVTVAAVLLASTAWAVKPGQWVHQTEADFGAGEVEHLIVTNLGEVQLARATSPVAELTGDDSIVYDLARLGDGRVYAAVGPTGKLAKLDGDRLVDVVAYDGEQVFALVATGNDLWVAVSGASSRLELRRGDDMAVVKSIPLGEDVRYVWDAVVVKEKLIVATGTKGKVLLVDPAAPAPAEGGDAAKPIVVLESTQKNVLCLGVDGAGRIYAGTDGEGLVYRITPKAAGGYESFVIYDAAEPEIGALLVHDDGTVYAGTADAEQAKPGRLAEASAEQRGRLEPPQPGSKEPTIPNVPPKPEPKDGEAPQPKPQDKPAGEKPAEPKPEQPAAEQPKPDVPGGAVKPNGDGALAARPTPEQYEALRTQVKEQLDAAREGGAVKLQAGPDVRPGGGARPGGGGGARRPGAAASKQGNAVYRISPDGFVKEVFRESVMILRIAQTGPTLLIATGNEGQVFGVDPVTEEVSTVADLEPQQAPAMMVIGDGDVLLGTANPGSVVRLYEKFAETGTLTSKPLDAEQVSLWGKFQVMAAMPEKTAIQIQTRSGNVADPDAGSWSEWSAPHTIALDAGASAYLDIASPTARFLQYRVTLKSDGARTPRLVRIGLHYLLPNLQPKIASVKSEYQKPKGAVEGEPAAMTVLKVDWEAADANGDTLGYKVEAAPFGNGAPFVTLADKLKTNSYEWDTRTTPDGRYVLRVTATDGGDNIAEQALTASRRSDPVLVDNTPPVFADLAAKVEGGVVTVTGKATDALSTLSEVRYKVDSAEAWTMVLPADLIFDSTSEALAVRIPDLAPGTHVVTLRATDALGNSRYETRTVEIPAK